MKHTKVITGVMVMKNDKAWGKTYEDGRSTDYGWMDPTDAPIYEPRYCRKPTDVTYERSHYISELKTGKIVRVKKTITVEIDE